MFGARIDKLIDHTRKVREAAARASRRAFAKTAFRIGGTAIRSIKRSTEPSLEGTPPHSRKGLLSRAIRYAADAEGAVIGPRESVVGTAGAAHEFGGEYRGGEFAERPFMAPALAANLDQFAGEFSGSITQ